MKQRSFNPVTWYIFLAGIAFVLASVITGLIYLIAIGSNHFLLDGEDIDKIPVTTGIIITVWLVGFLFFTLPEFGGGFTVPGTRKAVLANWIGIPLPFVLRSGVYKWTGKRLGFGKVRVVFGKEKGGFTDEDGNAIMGPITFSVWNTGHSTEKNRTTIIAPAHNRANIGSNLNFILQIEDLRKLLDQEDPAQDVGDRGRQEYREFVESFVDTDIPSLAHVATYVLTGEELVSCFLPEDIDVYKAGSMIRDRGGRALFALIKTGDGAKTRDEQIADFMDLVLSKAKPKLLDSVMKDGKTPGTKEVVVDSIRVEHPIGDVIEAVGMRLLRTTMSDVVFSDPVTAAANKASAEVDERNSQIASAKTNKAARAAMLPDAEELENPAWETAMLIQAAQDDKNKAIRIVVVPGGDKLTKAAVAGGSQIGGS